MTGNRLITMNRTPGRARKPSVCAAPGCQKLIRAGDLITRRPQGSWKHEDCSNPGRPFRGPDTTGRRIT
jgi:hypothetical protein